jgi:hypothetical protein
MLPECRAVGYDEKVIISYRSFSNSSRCDASNIDMWNFFVLQDRPRRGRADDPTPSCKSRQKVIDDPSGTREIFPPALRCPLNGTHFSPVKLFPS